MIGVKENKFTTEQLEALGKPSEGSSFNGNERDGRAFDENLTARESRFYATNCMVHECGYRGTGWCNKQCTHFVLDTNGILPKPQKAPAFTKKSEKSVKFIISQRLATIPSNIEVFESRCTVQDSEVNIWEIDFGIETVRVEGKCTVSVPVVKGGQLRVYGIYKNLTPTRYGKFADFEILDK